MRLFHISDLHIGKNLHGYNLREDQEYILNEIVNQINDKQPQVLMITGDIYDKSVPSAEAVLVFDNFLSTISKKFQDMLILIIAGNHDSAERIDYAKTILAHQNIYICGMPPRSEDEHIMKVEGVDEFGPIDFYLLPFVKPSMVNKLFLEGGLSYNECVSRLISRENIDFSKRNVILAHQFFVPSNGKVETSDSEAIVVGGIDNVYADCIKEFDYCALGHIHKPQRIGENILYAGSPLKYSSSEANQIKSINMIDILKKGDVRVSHIELQPLRNLIVLKGKLSDIIANFNEKDRQSYVSITVTDEDKLYKPKETLEAYYENIIEFKIDNSQIRKEIYDYDEEIKLEDPIKAFGDFYENANGITMTDDEKEIMIKVFNEVKLWDQKN